MAQFNSYPTKATPIAADTVLIYDSAGAVLKQVPIKNLFENYAGTSLGGSTQTVKSAIDALNSKIGSFNNTQYYYNDIPSESQTYELDNGSVYLIIVARLNNSSDSIGLYLSNSHQTSLLVPIVNISSSLAEVSQSGVTLTITIKSRYVMVGIIKITSI